MRHIAVSFALFLFTALAHAQGASQIRVEILDTASETIDRDAFTLFRNSVRDALRAAGYDAVLANETLIGRRERGDTHDGYCIDIAEARAQNRIAATTGQATSATGGVMIPAWEGLATVELNVLDASGTNVLATYKLRGIDTGLVGGTHVRGRAATGAFRPADPFLGYLVGGIFNAGRSGRGDAVSAVASDIAMRMKEDLSKQ